MAINLSLEYWKVGNWYMLGNESNYPRDWLDIAERDIARVGRCLRDDDPEAAGFFLQQALEKYLKAFLLFRGWTLRRIHDLEALLDEAVAFDVELETYRSLCQQVTGYYLIERYPLVGVTPPTVEDIFMASEAAEGLFEKIRGAIQN